VATTGTVLTSVADDADSSTVTLTTSAPATVTTAASAPAAEPAPAPTTPSTPVAAPLPIPAPVPDAPISSLAEQTSAMPLSQPVDLSVPTANELIGSVARSVPVVSIAVPATQAPETSTLDLNALPAAAAGFSDAQGFPLARVRFQGGQYMEVSNSDFGNQIGLKLLPSEGHRLFVYRGVPDMQWLANQGFGSLRIPDDAFAHTDPSAVVQLEARLATGAPLPGWLKFEGLRGTFSGSPPESVSGVIEVEVVAKDDQGREARTVFKLRIEELRAEDRLRQRTYVDPALGLDVDKKEKEKAQQKRAAAALGLDVDKKEAEKALAEAKARGLDLRDKGKTADKDKVKHGSARFSEQVRAAKTVRDPLLNLIAAGSDNPNRNSR
jgi:hypothetical protein